MDISSIKKLLEEFKDLIKIVAENVQVGWVGRLAIIEIILLAGLNPIIATTVYKQFTSAPIPRHYTTFWASAVAIVFVVAVTIYIRTERSQRQSRVIGERSTIKGLLPFSFADREIFRQLEREAEIIDCCEAITNHNFRFGVLTGESGSGKTSFLQAGLGPALINEFRCVYVKITDLDPVASIKQAIVEQRVGIPENLPADMRLSDLLAIIAQADSKPLLIFLDQFEQFFVHYKREIKRRPFVRELNDWFRKGKQTPIKILICIRGDFFDHLSELQEIMGYSLGPQQKFRLKKFRPEQASAIFKVISEKEKIDFDENFIKELTEQELAGADDGLISPVDIQILSWMIAGRVDNDERAFKRSTFQKLGGVEGLLERFLMRALDARETQSRREVATKILLSLTDLERNTRAGTLTIDDLSNKLAGTKTSNAELKEGVEWLSRSDVRLIVQVKRKEVEGYELAHERLIPALRRIAGKQLTETDRVELLLDRRVNEWLGNNRNKRYRLFWSELRPIKQQAPFIQWEPRQKEKRELITISWRALRFRIVVCLLPFLFLFSGLITWQTQWGQLQILKLEVARSVKFTTNLEALKQLTTTYAAMSDYSEAVTCAEKIPSNLLKADALLGVAEISDKLGDKRQAIELLKKAIQLIENSEDTREKIPTLRVVLELASSLGEPQLATDIYTIFLNRSEKSDFISSYDLLAVCKLASDSAAASIEKPMIDFLRKRLQILVRENIDVNKSQAIRNYAEIMARLGAKVRNLEYINEAQLATVKCSNLLDTLSAAPIIADSLAVLGEKEQAVKVLQNNLIEDSKITDVPISTEYSKPIIETMVRIGEKKKALGLLGPICNPERFNNNPTYLPSCIICAQTMAILGERQKAIKFFQDSLQILKQNNNRTSGFRSNSNSFFKFDINDSFAVSENTQKVAIGLAQLGEKEKDINLVHQAIQIGESLSIGHHKSQVLTEVIQIAVKLNIRELDELFDHVFRVIEGCSENEKEFIVTTFIMATAKIGENQLALKYLQRSNQLLSSMRKNSFKISGTLAIADRMIKLGMEDQALSLFQEARLSAETINDSSRETALSSIAMAIAKLGEKHGKIDLVGQALQIGDKLNFEPTRGNVLVQIATIAATLGDFRLARNIASKQTSIAAQARTRVSVLETWARAKKPNLKELNPKAPYVFPFALSPTTWLSL